MTPPDTPTSKTQESLIAAALKLFGRDGYEGTSTRKIAALAQTNIAAIAYHFGGKAGLRLACAKLVASRVQHVMTANESPPDLTPDQAVARIERNLETYLKFITLDPRAEVFSAFVLREIYDNGPAMDIFYTKVFEPKHRELCHLWSVATGADPDSEATKLTIFTLIGQALFFRIGQPIIRRRMDWPEFSPENAESVKQLIFHHLHSALDAAKRKSHA